MSTPITDRRNLFEAILSLETVEDAGRFFRDLLTESEIAEFSNRWKAAQMLDVKKPYTVIIKETGLSSTTVARISKWLHGNVGGYRRVLEKMQKDDS
jgi:TrpR-related protein YerC/YecD